MITNIYIGSSKESMIDKGFLLGLKGDALDRFKYTAYEVKLTLDVDINTGKSTIIAVDDRKVESVEHNKVPTGDPLARPTIAPKGTDSPVAGMSLQEFVVMTA